MRSLKDTHFKLRRRLTTGTVAKLSHAGTAGYKQSPMPAPAAFAYRGIAVGLEEQTKSRVSDHVGPRHRSSGRGNALNHLCFLSFYSERERNGPERKSSYVGLDCYFFRTPVSVLLRLFTALFAAGVFTAGDEDEPVLGLV